MAIVHAGGTFENYWGPVYACPSCNCNWSNQVCANVQCDQYGKQIPVKEQPDPIGLEQVRAMLNPRGDQIQ